MDRFRELVDIILSIKVQANEFEGKYYYFIADPIIDKAYGDDDFLQLRRDAITDLLDKDIAISQRHLTRLKRTIKELDDFMFGEGKDYPNEHLFDQIDLMGGMKGFIIKRKNTHPRGSEVVYSDNFILELKNELEARLDTIERIEEDVLLLEPERFSIYSDGTQTIVSEKGIPGENELPWTDWAKITEHEVSPRIKKGRPAIANFEDLFYPTYRKNVGDFVSILKSEPPAGRKTLVNTNGGWIGPKQAAKVFYNAMKEAAIMKEASELIIGSCFDTYFEGLGKSFAKQKLGHAESDYKEYFKKEIKLKKTKIDSDIH